MGKNPLVEQEFTIAVGDTMKDIVEFLKVKDYKRKKMGIKNCI